MTVTIEPAPSPRLATVRASGIVREAEVHAAVDDAFERGVLGPGVDRLILVPGSARLYLLDMAALERIRDRLHAQLTRDGAEPAHRVAIVARSPLHEGLAHLYIALWEGLDLPGVEFRVMSSEAAALDWMDHPPELAGEVAARSAG